MSTSQVPLPPRPPQTGQTYWEKGWEKCKQQPFVPIGVFATCVAFVGATHQLRGVTIAACVIGSYVYGQQALVDKANARAEEVEKIRLAGTRALKEQQQQQQQQDHPVLRKPLTVLQTFPPIRPPRLHQLAKHFGPSGESAQEEKDPDFVVSFARLIHFTVASSRLAWSTQPLIGNTSVPACYPDCHDYDARSDANPEYLHTESKDPLTRRRAIQNSPIAQNSVVSLVPNSQVLEPEVQRLLSATNTTNSGGSGVSVTNASGPRRFTNVHQDPIVHPGNNLSYSSGDLVGLRFPCVPYRSQLVDTAQKLFDIGRETATLTRTLATFRRLLIVSSLVLEFSWRHVPLLGLADRLFADIVQFFISPQAGIRWLW
ncbi:hypothetical protein BS47DRAFT_1382294 [Hydnum rufescens UP504]|uniref:Uncharacterized protein n=1 Tax=Hydnum rufescens UP504 TaxID=1448309 RepID=A0A9P6DWK0_9AGAM|nr:hypothetical protein BS47DRAFT_1382294 [Hydnum rufescens UP504]